MASDGGGQTFTLSPEDSLTEALEEVLPGDTYLLTPGIYNERIELSTVGGNEPITIRGEGEGAILDGQRELEMGFWCRNCTTFIVENLEIRNYTGMGIGFEGCQSLRIGNLTVHSNGFAAQLRSWEIEGYGIQIDECSGVVVEENLVYENGPNPKTSRTPMGTGIDVFGCSGCRIINNEVYSNIGVMLVEDSVNVLVEGNEIYGNDVDATDVSDWWDAGLWVDGGYDITIRGNTFRDNLGPGIQISNEDDQEIYGYVVEDNIITGNYFGLYVWGFGSDDLPPENVLRLEGNAISGNRDFDSWVKVGWCPPPEPCEDE
ncbi:MAG: right-handed parallel beta-helix repeat-containing protein [Anaerolineae bacterium]|nr:right-handed parallel beta-helix repeat-containing protein [Anaerolineae bacterium]